VLTGDMGRQFVAFFKYFKTVFTSNADFSYTFYKTLGGDMPGFSAYYLHNPLLFILFLFPEEKIAVGIEVLILLQTALCGLSASVFLNNVNKPSPASLIFSTAYSGMGFIYAYFVCTLYFSNLALLPLVLLAFSRFLGIGQENEKAPAESLTDSEDGSLSIRGKIPQADKKSMILFILLTALYVFMSYYMGYMLMLFLVILYLAALIEDFSRIRKLPSFAFALATALLLNGVFLLMTALSLRGEKSSVNADFGFYRRFKLADFLSVLLAGNDSASQLPMVYSSLTAVCFLILFFLLKRPVREKLAALFVLAALYISMWINTLDSVWHGFNNPQGFPFRYSFLFSLAVIFPAYRSYLEIREETGKEVNIKYSLSCEDKKRWKTAAALGITFLIPVILYIMKNPYVSTGRLIISGAVLCLTGLSLIINKRSKKAAFILCLATVISEVTLSAVTIYPAYNAEGEDGTLPLISEFNERYRSIDRAVETCRPKGEELYRMEKDFLFTPNDSMLFDYPGLSHYSSCEKAEVRHFMERMGFRDTGVYAYYGPGSTAFADALLGVRYYISRFDETYKPYDYVSSEGDYYVYENPHALKMAFPADEGIKDFDIEAENIFECQNALAKMTGGAEAKKTEAEKTGSERSGDGKGDLYIKAEYDRTGSDKELTYNIHIMDRLPLYFYFESEDPAPVEIYVNGTDWDHYFTDSNEGVLNAGTYDPGTELEISLKALGDRVSVSGAYFYYENTGAFADWGKRASKRAASSLQMMKSSELHYDMKVPENSMIVMSIPFDRGWRIRVDGIPVKAEKVLGALLAIPAKEGNHSIDMRYIPEGFYPGLVISFAGFMMLAALCIRKEHKGI